MLEEPTTRDQHRTMVLDSDVTNVSWRDLGVSSASCHFLENELGFSTATAVQASTIPLLLARKDAVVQAMTGSGKTLAYLIPIIEALLPKEATSESMKLSIHTIKAITVVPTRELGKQVHTILQQYVNSILGGSPQKPSRSGIDIRTMRVLGGYETVKDLERYQQKGCHVLIATPGRLVELLSFTQASTVLRVAHLDTLILDEADQLLSMGFGPQLDAIFSRLPRQRQTALFSATQTREVTDLTRCGFRQPVMVNVQQQFHPACADQTSTAVPTDLPQIPAQLDNTFCTLRYDQRFDALLAYLRGVFGPSGKEKSQMVRSKILIYVLTCASVDWLFTALNSFLAGQSIDVYSLHGKQKSSSRSRTIQSFVECERGILTLTDVGARGLDIPLVDIVIQFDAPKNPLSFIHRIGRTARMGKRGVSLTFFDPTEIDAVEYFRQQNVDLREILIKGVPERVDEPVDERRLLGSAVLKKGDWSRLKAEKGKGKMQTSCVSTPVVENLCITKMRELYIERPEFLKSATKAFVCFIKGYKQHILRYIFRASVLDVVDLCNGFGLFFLPNLSELRHMERINIGVPEKFHKHLPALHPEKKVKTEEIDRKRSVKNKMMEQVKKSDLGKGEKKRLFLQVHVDEVYKDAAALKKLRKGRLDDTSFLEATGFGNESLSSSGRQTSASKGKEKRPTDHREVFVSASSSENEMDIDTAPHSFTQRARKRRKKRR